MAVKTYNFRKVNVIVGGRQITGFDEGSPIKVERNDDAVTLDIGADGEGVRSKSNNFSGKFTFSLMGSSDSNKILADFAQADEDGDLVIPVLVKDNSGKSLHAAEQAWIVKSAPAEYGKKPGSREWILETDRLIHYVAGN